MAVQLLGKRALFPKTSCSFLLPSLPRRGWDQQAGFAGGSWRVVFGRSKNPLQSPPTRGGRETQSAPPQRTWSARVSYLGTVECQLTLQGKLVLIRPSKTVATIARSCGDYRTVPSQASWAHRPGGTMAARRLLQFSIDERGRFCAVGSARTTAFQGGSFDNGVSPGPTLGAVRG